MPAVGHLWTVRGCGRLGGYARAVPRPTSSALGVAAVVAGSLLFAVNGTVAKLAMDAGLGPTRLVELRCLGSAVVLVTAALVVSPRKLRPTSRREVAVLALLGVVGGFVPVVLRKFDVNTTAVQVGLGMTGLSAVFLFLCVRSFIAARKARQAGGSVA